MSLWTDIRDTAETAGVLYGNYLLPGSSMITSKLVSDGSQEQLNSDTGKLAQLGSGGFGISDGNLANWTGGDSGVSGIDLGGPGSGPGWENSLQSGIDLGGPGSSPTNMGDSSLLSKAKGIFDMASDAKKVSDSLSSKPTSGGGGQQATGFARLASMESDDADYKKAERREVLIQKAQSLRQRIAQLRAQVAQETTANTGASA